MKIVVIGGTGLMGSASVKKLRSKYEAVVAPNTGVSSITGEGFVDAVKTPRWSSM